MNFSILVNRFFRLWIRWCILYSSLRLTRSILIASYNCEQVSFLSLSTVTCYAALMQSRSPDLALMLPTLVRPLFLDADSEESCSRCLLYSIFWRFVLPNISCPNYSFSSALSRAETSWVFPSLSNVTCCAALTQTRSFDWRLCFQLLFVHCF